MTKAKTESKKINRKKLFIGIGIGAVLLAGVFVVLIMLGIIFPWSPSIELVDSTRSIECSVDTPKTSIDAEKESTRAIATNNDYYRYPLVRSNRH